MYAKWTDMWVPAAAALVLLSMVSSGCGVEGDERPGGTLNLGGERGFGGAPPSLGACSQEGEQKECTVYVHQANGVTSCFSGAQFCDEGEWSDCLPLDQIPISE